MAKPTGSPVIEATGGLRKLRFAPAKWNIGKSAGVRVGYVYFEEYALVLLCAAYSHNEKDNLSAKEKKGIKREIDTIRRYLSERAYK
jgi:hypothetical protein